MPTAKKNRTGAHLVGVGNKVPSENDGAAADDNDAADVDHNEPHASSRARKEQDANDRQLEREMEEEVVSDDDHHQHDECAAGTQRKRKERAPRAPFDQPDAAPRRRKSSAAKSKATAKSLAASALKSNLSMYFQDAMRKEKQPETPAIAQAMPAVISDGSTTGAECTTPEPTGPTLTANGKRVGRPPNAEAQGICSTAAAYASHGGSRPSALGNATTSKAQRRSLREWREGGGEGEATAVAAEAAAGKRLRRDKDTSRGPQLLPRLMCDHSELCAALKRTTCNLHFKRSDFEGGEEMSKVEWLQLRAEPHELRRVKAMAHFVMLQESGLGVEVALAQVCEGVLIGSKQKQLSSQTLRQWLQLYIKKQGRLTRSQAGCHVSTESFLADEDLRAQALLWLRKNCRAAQAKGSTIPMLRPKRFCDWVNSELLQGILAADPERKPIHEKSAQRWMHTLGFGYQSHQKGMYFDGHERRDVQIDRDEKMVMLQARYLSTCTATTI